MGILVGLPKLNGGFVFYRFITFFMLLIGCGVVANAYADAPDLSEQYVKCVQQLDADDKSADTSCVELAQKFMSLPVLVQNQASAFNLLAKATKAGDAVAPYLLAKYIENGRFEGVIPTDEKFITTLYQKSAILKYAPAQFSLSKRYFLGVGGIQKDDTVGVFLLQSAASQHDQEALLDLADRYKGGQNGLPQSNIISYALHILARDEAKANIPLSVIDKEQAQLLAKKLTESYNFIENIKKASPSNYTQFIRNHSLIGRCIEFKDKGDEKGLAEIRNIAFSFDVHAKTKTWGELSQDFLSTEDPNLNRSSEVACKVIQGAMSVARERIKVGDLLYEYPYIFMVNNRYQINKYIDSGWFGIGGEADGDSTTGSVPMLLEQGTGMELVQAGTLAHEFIHYIQAGIYLPQYFEKSDLNEIAYVPSGSLQKSISKVKTSAISGKPRVVLGENTTSLDDCDLTPFVVPLLSE